MNVKIYTIPAGDRGIRRTVRKMGQLVHEALVDPVVVETAATVASFYCCPAEGAQAIRAYLESYVVFTPDPVGYELVRTPAYMLRRIGLDGVAYGDCDDVATLGATFGMAAGMPARFVLLGFDPRGPFSHVYAELYTPQGWADLDTTAPEQFPPGLRAHKLERIDV